MNAKELHSGVDVVQCHNYRYVLLDGGNSERLLLEALMSKLETTDEFI